MGKAYRNLFSGVFAAAALLGSGSVGAVPVSFSISSASFLPGTGYGIDDDEGSATLLDVRFSTAVFLAQNFNLDLPSPSSSNFLFGTVNLAEPNGHSGITANETDDLDVTASFTFTSPLGAAQNLIAVGIATTGAVSDSHVDYTLTWTPLVVNFGSGGEFRIALDDLTFYGVGTQSVRATVTLLESPSGSTLPVAAVPAAVPEPTTLALFGLGLAGLGFARRKAQ